MALLRGLSYPLCLHLRVAKVASSSYYCGSALDLWLHVRSSERVKQYRGRHHRTSSTHLAYPVITLFGPLFHNIAAHACHARLALPTKQSIGEAIENGRTDILYQRISSAANSQISKSIMITSSDKAIPMSTDSGPVPLLLVDEHRLRLIQNNIDEFIFYYSQTRAGEIQRMRGALQKTQSRQAIIGCRCLVLRIDPFHRVLQLTAWRAIYGYRQLSSPRSTPYRCPLILN